MHPSVSLATITPDDLSPYLNTPFKIHGDQARLSQITLTDVTPFGRKIKGRRDQFSIVFSGTTGEVWPQRIYQLDHDELGTLELFLVPISTSAAGTRYEAVFA